MKTHLIIIDPQYDFCNSNGALFVHGADRDMERLSAMIDRVGDKINQIHVTLDSHHLVDISHPIFFLDKNGNHPDPFTVIDLEKGELTTTRPSFFNRALEYDKQLKINGRYGHVIWPPHCLIGSLGATVNETLYRSLLNWESKFRMVNYVTKGSNFWTEHYSGVQADVPDPDDEGTLLNMTVIDMLKKADLIGISGEALNFCVANTITDIANVFGEENIKKFVLIEDTSSIVPGFDDLTKAFMDNLTNRGMKICRSIEFLA